MSKRDPLNNLPKGITPEMLDEYARARANAIRRANYAKHPERVEKHRMTTYTNFLNRHGMIVIPSPSALPWTDEQKETIINSVLNAMQEQGDGTK